MRNYRKSVVTLCPESSGVNFKFWAPCKETHGPLPGKVVCYNHVLLFLLPSNSDGSTLADYYTVAIVNYLGEN